MASRVAAELIPPVYEDFDPSSDIVHEKDGDTILLNLPGFRKDHLKVQLTTSKILRISGSRQAEDNIWRRFQKEFPVTPGHDTQRISAKFEGGMLYVRVPFLIPPVGKKEEKHDTKLPATHPATTPQEPKDQSPPQKSSAQEQATNEKPAWKEDPTKQNSAHIVKEEPQVTKEKIVEPTDSEKKAKKSPDLDESKTKGIAGDKQEDDRTKKSPDEKPSSFEESIKKSNASDKPENDSAKKHPEEKPSGLDDSKKKSIASDEHEDDSKKATEKREREFPGTEDGSDKSKADKETEVDPASKLKKHRRMFNLTLVTILAVALGLYITNFIKTLKRSEN